MTSNDENTDGTDNSDNDDEATKGGKRRERLEQNRISARESRKRKKNMIEELQRMVITLSRENKELNERNETLRRELVEIGTKNPVVVRIVLFSLPCCLMRSFCPRGADAPHPFLLVITPWQTRPSVSTGKYSDVDELQWRRRHRRWSGRYCHRPSSWGRRGGRIHFDCR
jgi:hypothetical protein